MEHPQVLLMMRNITKEFFNVKALNNVTIDLRRGEILGLVGENGAGKSTLMKILSGAYPSGTFSGEIIIEGRPYSFQNRRQSQEAGIEMIYQEISLHLDLTVAENIFLGRLPTRRRGWVDWPEVYRQASEALKLVGLDVDVRSRVRSLSTSQQQLLCIAKALVRNPKILVLDERTSALTEAEVLKLLQLIQGLKEKGISCIYISHKLDEVFTIADRITVLRDGQVIATYERDQVKPEKVVEDMVGRKLEKMFPKVEVEIGPEVFRVEGLTVPHPLAPEKNIIEGISFSLRRGEILGLAGLVGSGRSELVGALFGAIPTRGKPAIYLEGQRVEIKSPLDAVKLGIGFVTEDRRVSGFIGSMNIRENITLASLDKISRGGFIQHLKESSWAGELVKRLQIKCRDLEDSVLALSGGNQQKVVLAKWLMRDVKVLFLDEPTRGIDVGAKVEVYNIMVQMARKGVGIIMISSELPELLSMCDRILVLARGRIQDEFTRAEASQERIMRAATGVVA